MFKLPKNTTIIFLGIISLAFFGVAGVVSAAPIVTGVTGDLTNGASVTVAGSGFGVKVQVAPIIWESFEDCVDGTPLNIINPNWLIQKDAGGICTNEAYTGSYAVKNISSYPYVNDFANNYKIFTPTDSVYYTYIFKSRLDSGNGYGVGKAGRIGSDYDMSYSYYDGPGTAALSNYNFFYHDTIVALYNTGSSYAQYYLGNNINCTILNHECNPSNNVWTRHEMYKLNSTPGINNGIFWAATDGMVAWEQINTITRETGQTWKNNSVLLPLMYTNLQEGGQISMFVDSVYVDNTLARVELCDSAMWTTNVSKHCEIQIPHSIWNESQIQFTINQGSFADFNNAYLYVIDANGNVNANGYLLTTPPPTPLKGDFNSDSKVNDLDFTSFKNAFKSIFNSIFDLNSDNTIDVKDLGVLMSGWLP